MYFCEISFYAIYSLANVFVLVHCHGNHIIHFRFVVTVLLSENWLSFKDLSYYKFGSLSEVWLVIGHSAHVSASIDRETSPWSSS